MLLDEILQGLESPLNTRISKGLFLYCNSAFPVLVPEDLAVLIWHVESSKPEQPMLSTPLRFWLASIVSLLSSQQG